MFITRTCPITGKRNTLDIPVTEAQILRWKSGELIQRAMPKLTSDEREFIMTGILPHVWDSLFKEE
jgi:hypothetical protein